MNAARPIPMWAVTQERELVAMTYSERIALVVGERKASRKLIDQFGEILGIDPVSVSEVGLTPAPVGTISELLGRLENTPLLYDLEALCWQPWLRADPVRLLRMHARHRGVIAVWPGEVSKGMASFSTQGRVDHVSCYAAGLSVLRPVATRFPDEVPYTLERIP